MLEKMNFNWEPFSADFDYDKEFYDVQLPGGEIIKHCWPNAGYMNATDNSGRRWRAGDPDLMVRFSPDSPLFEKDGEPTDGTVLVVGSPSIGKTTDAELKVTIQEALKKHPKIRFVDDVGAHTPRLAELMADTLEREKSQDVFMYHPEPKPCPSHNYIGRFGQKRHPFFAQALAAAAMGAMSGIGLPGMGALDFGARRRGPRYQSVNPSPDLDSANAKIAAAGGRVVAESIAQRAAKLARRAARGQKNIN